VKGFDFVCSGLNQIPLDFPLVFSYVASNVDGLRLLVPERHQIHLLVVTTFIKQSRLRISSLFQSTSRICQPSAVVVMAMKTVMKEKMRADQRRGGGGG